MKLIIAEDDPNKLKSLVEFVRGIHPEWTIIEKRSYRSGLKAIIEESPNLVILDMSMPTFDVSLSEKGGRTRAYAGREILAELRRRKLLAKVVIVTQFESFGEGAATMTLTQLREQLAAKFATNYIDTVYYQASESNWKKSLASLLDRLSLAFK